MVRQRGYWTRPTSRTYMYNLDVGEHYYSPMTSYLSTERGSRGETPGALTFDERLGKNTVDHSDVVGKQKSGSGLGSAFWVRVRFGDQHFGDIPLRFFKVKFRIG